MVCNIRNIYIFVCNYNGVKSQVVEEITHTSLNIRREMDKAELLEELLIRRKFPLDALKLYYLFLRRYFSPNRQEFDSAFYSRTKLCDLLREDAQNIRGELDSAQLTKSEKRRGKKPVFLSTNQAYLLELFQLLIDDKERRLIKSQDRDTEFMLYPEVFDHLQLDKRTTTWTQTLQPLIVWFTGKSQEDKRLAGIEWEEAESLMILEGSRARHNDARKPQELIPILGSFFGIQATSLPEVDPPVSEAVCYQTLLEIGFKDPTVFLKLAKQKGFCELAEYRSKKRKALETQDLADSKKVREERGVGRKKTRVKS